MGKVGDSLCKSENCIKTITDKKVSVCVADIKNLKEPVLVKGIPIFGNALSMRKDPAKFFYNCYREYGSVFRLRLMNKTCTVLAGVESANFMGTREGIDVLNSKKIWHGLEEEYGCEHFLLSQEGDTHQKLRAAMRHGHSKESLEGRYDDLILITHSMIAHNWPVGQLVPVVNNMERIIVEQIGLILMDKSPSEYIDNVRKMNLYVLNTLVRGIYPKFILKDPRYKRAKKKVFEFVQQMIVDYRSRKNIRGSTHRNLMDDIMETHARDPDLITTKDFGIFLTGPFVAGLETMASTTASFIYEVLKHPEVHALVCKEADALFAKSAICEKDLLNLPTINGALMETMRMHPVASALPRIATRDFAFHGYRIPAGERLYMATTVPHFMEEYYLNPEIFDINRYTRPRNEHLKPGVYSPFGRGPHICLGQSVAKVQMLLTVARLFYDLELELESPDYQLKAQTLPLPRSNLGFKVRVKNRRH